MYLVSRIINYLDWTGQAMTASQVRMQNGTLGFLVRATDGSRQFVSRTIRYKMFDGSPFTAWPNNYHTYPATPTVFTCDGTSALGQVLDWNNVGRYVSAMQGLWQDSGSQSATLQYKTGDGGNWAAAYDPDGTFFHVDQNGLEVRKANIMDVLGSNSNQRTCRVSRY
jgi:hypothetical protein